MNPARLLLPLILALGATIACAEAPNPVPPQWDRADAEALLSYIEGVGAEGLDPADYDSGHLRASITAGNASAAATATFLHLATDLRQGIGGGDHRIAWHISDPPIDEAAQRAVLAQALAGHRVAETLASLLPSNPEYLALKAALAATPRPDRASVQQIRANLERWRWMPHDLGRRYILVNVPAFELQLVEDGRPTERHKLVVGKASTPTPQFGTLATGLIFNPWWDVPRSIVAESVGRLIRTNPTRARAQGYVWSAGHVRQVPGPGNSLGQMKLVMPNPFTVYIHDTPTKLLFDKDVRAFSHGCIRTQDPFDLAEHLLGGMPGWDRKAIDRVVASRVSTKVDFPQSIPVYVTYFTAARDAGGTVRLYPDIYGGDRAVVAALTNREAMNGASR